jgi:plastocyanin
VSRKQAGLATVMLVALAVIAAGCSGSSDDDHEPTTATITISGFSFGEPITIRVGDTVAVTNDDGLTHTWTSSEGVFNSGGLDPGESFEFTFDEAGTYDFFCSIHREMTGSVTVEG